ncbi:amino acid ABC transporter permease [Burkholderia sp. Bp9017]|uniref:amino acid ABC transporter permease n=1 Tax=unclassified Burkholderia TaxID=2613784 RepID=UPI000F5D6EAD|nr:MULTISPECIES: amino acid ABC transporter permease [unclassified Burkholderia]RQZ15012.1 amino acid ABC transporter permease [Burkholderia sp. Bp9017]RQZ26604.1 amino acid ABC transporter permease [Burkholderia sp. Bp9016]
MNIVSETSNAFVDRDTLSPAPKSLPLSIAAITASLALLLLIATIGGALMVTSTHNRAGNIIGLAISSVGVVAAAVSLWYSVAALRLSLKAQREARRSDILAARASADGAKQDALISFGLNLTYLIILMFGLFLTINDGSIQKTFLRIDVIKECFFDVLRAFGVNIWMALVSQALVLVFGLVLAVMRMIPGRAGAPVRALAIAYIDIMRAVPAIIVLYLVGFGLPLAKIPLLSDLSPEWYAIFALTMTFSAYAAETYRAGIESIHPSQWSSTRSLGFSYGQTLRYVILPQAVRRVIPPLLGGFIALQKDTSLVNIIGTVDAFNQAKFYASSNFNLSSVTVVAALFVMVTIPQTRFVDWMLARSSTRRQKGK